MKDMELAVRWIRANCYVDTGDGIGGDAFRYSAAQIEDAIRSWNKEHPEKTVQRSEPNIGR